MLYSTVPQPVDEDLVQRLREKGACEMATHPHRPARAAPRSPALDSPSLGTRLLTAAQWSLALLGIFCLIGVAVVIATTPQAWPL